MKSREELIHQARDLRRPSAASAQAFEAAGPALASALSAAMEARSDLEEVIGPGNLAMMRNNHANQVRYMESVFHLYDPESFVDTLVWVLRTYRAHGFRPDYWDMALGRMRELLLERLEPAVAAEIAPFYAWIVENMPDLLVLSDSGPSPWEESPGHGEEGK